MRSSLCGKEGEREQNVRNEAREVNTRRRKIIIEHMHNVSCRKRQRRNKRGAYWVRTAGGREIVGRKNEGMCMPIRRSCTNISWGGAALPMLYRIKEQVQYFSRASFQCSAMAGDFPA